MAHVALSDKNPHKIRVKKNNKAVKIFVANQFIFTILQIKILITYLILN